MTKLLAAINGARRRKPPVHRQLRLPQGAIQNAVVAVLRNSPKPLNVRDVHALVERTLRRSVSYDTVSSYLSVAARDSRQPIARRGRGSYEAVRNGVEQTR